MDIRSLIKPELLVLIPVLYLIGMWLKSTPKVNNWVIPFVLGTLGIFLSTLWVFATGTQGQYALAIFAGITQGILCAGAAVYTNQLIKQGANANMAEDGGAVAGEETDEKG